MDFVRSRNAHEQLARTSLSPVTLYILISVLQNDNKMTIIQSIIIHDGISKPKILLDQFREGLSVLGLKEQMARHSGVFKPLFVPDTDSIHAKDVVSCLTFPASMEEGEANTSDYLKEFLQNATL